MGAEQNHGARSRSKDGSSSSPVKCRGMKTNRMDQCKLEGWREQRGGGKLEGKKYWRRDVGSSRRPKLPLLLAKWEE